MKLRHLMIAGAMALPLLASAKPAYPGIIRVPDNNGGYTEIRRHGDEFFSYTTDADCKVLLQRDADGRWAPMIRQGVQLTATQANIQMLRAENDEQIAAQNLPTRAPQRMANLNNQGRTTFPTLIGDMHALVVMIEYSDVKFTYAKNDFERLLNEDGYSEHKAKGSAAEYYKLSSYNQFRPTFDVAGIVTLPRTSAYYVGSNKYDRFKEGLSYAIRYLDSEGFDFSKYDCDNDGVIDFIYFIYAGYGQADTGESTAIWPHQGRLSDYYILVDGKRVDAYAASNELNGGIHYTNKDGAIDGIGTFCHEFGHVLGLPDLYDPNYAATSITPGDWSIMDNGSYLEEGYAPPTLSAYERWMLNWLEYTDAEDGEHYVLNPLNDVGSKAVKIPARRKKGDPYENEYFIAESRTKNAKWDSSLPTDGMLIWHIDYMATAWSTNHVNSAANHPRVSVVASDGSADPFKGGRGNPGAQAPWPGVAKVPALYPGSDPGLNTWSSGTEGNANVFVTNITFNAETGVSEFDFNKITEVPTGATTMNMPKRIEDKRSIRLNWEPDPKAKSYQLTVYRVNSAGSVFYEGGVNELNVGNVTRYDINNLTATKMGLTYYAYVRSVYELPSKDISNEVEFVPNYLEVTSGIGNVIADDAAPVLGGKGCIIAPADAEVYTPGGMRTGKENLAPGMYIVRTAGSVVKVVVR